MWDPQDLEGFKWESERGLGQVKEDQIFSKYIKELSSDKENKILVEIGTWNGLGSTKFFIQGLLNNKDAVFYTIENNLEKVNFAKSVWEKTIHENSLNVHFLHGSLISNESLSDYLKGTGDVYNEKELFWIDIDMKNSENNVITLPIDNIDVLLIDGGQYSGFLELMLLIDKSKYILLDDARTPKTEKARMHLLNHEDFELYFEDLDCRLGVSIFKRK